MTNTKHENIEVNLESETNESQFLSNVLELYRISSPLQRLSLLDEFLELVKNYVPINRAGC